MKKIIPFYFFSWLAAISLPAQSVFPVTSVYNQGELLQFTYSGGTASNFDWIGIYEDGETPGASSSIIWEYTSGSDGTLTFSDILSPGVYDVYFLCCDGYDILAAFHNLEIKESRIFSRLHFYKTTDSLVFTVNNIKANFYVKIYSADDFIDGELVPGSTALASQIIGSGSGTIATARKAFAPLALAGQYVSVIEKPSGNILYKTNFTVNQVAALPFTVTRIAAGSCAQNSSLPVIQNILSRNPELFIALGDNVYIDSYSESVLKQTYEQHLTDRFEFQELRSKIPIYATWDDHDYGCCDEDKDYPIKNESQEIFLNYWDEPLSSPRRTQEGIYTSYTIGPAGQKLQIIMLDTRYFLDNKRANTGCGINDYCPWNAPSDKLKTILGDEQWNWLKTQLLQPADLRLIVSSIQFGNSYNGYEQWAEFPYQQKKMINLLKKNNIDNVFFISGDVHYAEVSRYTVSGFYPIYDFTISALNQYWEPEANTNRVDDLVYGEPNAGLIDIDWINEEITFTCVNRVNEDQFSYTFPFSEISMKNNAIASQPVEFSIQPNPASANINIYFTQSFNGYVEIINSTGEIVKSIKVENEYACEVKNMTPGIYVINCLTSDGILSQKCVVE